MKLQVMQECKNAAGYIGMLERSLLFTEGARLCGEDWIFQQNNATIHTSCNSKDFSQANHIRLLVEVLDSEYSFFIVYPVSYYF